MSNPIFQGGRVGFAFLPIGEIANSLGVAEPPLRFMIGIFMGFPFAFVYLLLTNTRPVLKHLYISLSGLFISYFCFGSDCVYNIISVLVAYVSLTLLGSTKLNVILAFIFQMSYMLGSYVFFSSDGYDVKWTTPQCIMCLRLIGLAWDCYDGQQDKEKISADTKKTCYSGTPTFLEVFGFSFFFGAFMAGPQFSFQRYTSFVEGTLVDEEGMKTYNRRFVKAWNKFVAGVVILLIFVKFDSSYISDLMYKPAFMEKSFIARCNYMTLSYHIHFCKYVSIWFFCESVCMMVGLSYNGVKNKLSTWDGVCNFKIRACITQPFFQDMLDSFNINTSQWARRYVFKRLIFLGNKDASQILTLAFLSLWHGFYVGYPILFIIEFLLLDIERKLCSNLRKMTNTTYLELPTLARLVVRVVYALFKAYSCAFAATAFVLLRWRRIKVAYASVNFWLLIVIALFTFVVNPLIAMVAKNKRIDEKKKD